MSMDDKILHFLTSDNTISAGTGGIVGAIMWVIIQPDIVRTCFVAALAALSGVIIKDIYTFTKTYATKWYNHKKKK